MHSSKVDHFNFLEISRIFDHYSVLRTMFWAKRKKCSENFKEVTCLRTVATRARSVRPICCTQLGKNKQAWFSRFLQSLWHFTDYLKSNLGCSPSGKSGNNNILCAVLPRRYACEWQVSENHCPTSNLTVGQTLPMGHTCGEIKVYTKKRNNM